MHAFVCWVNQGGEISSQGHGVGLALQGVTRCHFAPWVKAADIHDHDRPSTRPHAHCLKTRGQGGHAASGMAFRHLPMGKA